MLFTKSFADARKSEHRQFYFFISLALFIVLMVPTVFLGVYFYVTTKTTNTTEIFARRSTIASLSASAIKIKLDSLGKIAEAFANQKTTIVANVQAGNWKAAIESAENLSNDPTFYDSFIDRILLIDENGVIKSAYPNLYGSVGQKSLTLDEWRSALLEGKNNYYVTNVYRRLGVPRINVVGIFAPIRNGSSILGYISLQVPINNFSDFGKDVDIGNDGFVYVFDRLGHIVSHPKYSSSGPVVDFSQVPSVNKVIHGEMGVEVLYNPLERQERVAAYESIKDYGWGVVAQEPTVEAFAEMNYLLFEIVLLTIVVCFLEFFTVLFVWGVLHKFKRDVKE